MTAGSRRGFSLVHLGNLYRRRGAHAGARRGAEEALSDKQIEISLSLSLSLHVLITHVNESSGSPCGIRCFRGLLTPGCKAAPALPSSSFSVFVFLLFPRLSCLFSYVLCGVDADWDCPSSPSSSPFHPESFQSGRRNSELALLFCGLRRTCVHDGRVTGRGRRSISPSVCSRVTSAFSQESTGASLCIYRNRISSSVFSAQREIPW